MGKYNIFWIADPITAFDNLLTEQGADGAYRLSPNARLRFQTDATTVDLDIVSDIFGNYPTFAKIGVLVNGAVHATITASAAAMTRYTQSLPAGSGKVVEFITGLQSRPIAAILGTFIRMATFPQNTNTALQAGPAGDKLLIYGDSIPVGANATDPATEGWPALLSDDWIGQTIVEAFGFRALRDDAVDTAARSAFVSKIASQSPATIWLAIGTNDYGLNKWSAASFGTAYAALLDDLHTALPSATIYCQTPILRVAPAVETANGSGSTLGNYRTQIGTAVATRGPWAILVDGTLILSAGPNYDADGIHPTTAGHATYYASAKATLGL